MILLSLVYSINWYFKSLFFSSAGTSLTKCVPKNSFSGQFLRFSLSSWDRGPEGSVAHNTGLHSLNFFKSKEEELIILITYFLLTTNISATFSMSVKISRNFMLNLFKNYPKMLSLVSVNAEDNKTFQCYTCVKFF